MYPEEMCVPMREDLTSVGFIALRTPEEVSKLLDITYQQKKNSLFLRDNL